MKTTTRTSECVGELTSTHSSRTVVPMRIGDVTKGLDLSYRDAFERLTAIRNEQNTIRSQHRRFLDLDADAKRYEERIRRIGATLRNLRKETLSEHDAVLLELGKNYDNAIAIAATPEENLPLWEVIATILAETQELQVIELERILEYLGFKTTRSAVESSLKTHPNEFRIRMSGRNKFVSLKGA